VLIRTEGNVQRDRFFPAREAETHLLGCLGGSVTLPIVPDIEIDHPPGQPEGSRIHLQTGARATSELSTVVLDANPAS
jgi:hypothetical protein